MPEFWQGSDFNIWRRAYEDAQGPGLVERVDTGPTQIQASAPYPATAVLVEPSGDRPPPLRIYPDVSPVSALRNETARGYNLSDEARDVLWQTPIRYEEYDRFGDMENPGRMGEYHPYSGDIIVRAVRGKETYPGLKSPDESPQYGSYDPEPILMHELAHKWYYNEMPLDRRMEWDARSRWNRLTNEPYTQEQPWGSLTYGLVPESYAEAAAMRGQPGFDPNEYYGYGLGMVQDPGAWDRYYAGLYSDVKPNWR